MQSGVDTLPTFAGGLVCATIGGVALTKSARFKPLHIIGFALMTVAIGLFSLLDAISSPALWVLLQLVCATGSDLVIGVLLPVIPAPLDESLVATATGLHSFSHYFGCVWGVTLPSTILNNQCRHLASSVTDADIAGNLIGGRAYQYATKSFMDGIGDAGVREEVIGVFTGALGKVWLIDIAIAGVGLVITFAERETRLCEELNTEFALEEVVTREPTASSSVIELGPVAAVSRATHW